jgi:protein-tyrosine-phosphatase/DNA-binding HxlR family transcriptional regulator
MHTEPSLAERVALHRALGDPSRLAIIDALWVSDRTPADLAAGTGLRSNLLAFHLDVLERSGLVRRQPSQGDGRRRYVTLTRAALPHVGTVAPLAVECVLFVCTHNAARSQLAEALWCDRTGLDAASAGTQPADRVHPLAVAVAAEHGLDLSDAQPRRLADLDVAPDLVVSVCDRAHEQRLVVEAPRRHWSVPDPIDGDHRTFAAAYDDIADRVERLATALPV